MNTVILDIETIGLKPNELSDKMRHALTKDCELQDDIDDRLAKTALHPLTGKIICVGMLNPETQGYCLIGHDLVEDVILEMFWANVKKYQRVVTFNGRGFDIPYLLLRSAILGIQPSRLDLMGQRFSYHPHCDLLEQLSFYGASRKFSLDMYCEAFGIKSPKADCDGGKVAELYAAGEHQKIADYCAGDLAATAELYKVWLQRLCR